MLHYRPVETIADYRTLDEGEVMCGYMDGIQGIPCILAEVTRSYWHGWRNGVVDGGFIEQDDAQIRLDAEFMLLRD